MSLARAPGKLVLSGAYVVLDGAPSLVAAVDRYAIADSDRAATFVTEEVAEAIREGALTRAPWFDASALRTPLPDGSTRKLGLGSSAAILVASLGAAWGESSAPLSLPAVFRAAHAAHRAAQGGGSGIDVAASVYGGVLACRRAGDGELTVRAHALPTGLVVTVLASHQSASTSALVAKVRAFRAAEPATYARHMGEASEAAELAASCTSTASFVDAVRRQHRALGALGEQADAPIRTAEIARLAALADSEDAAFGPSGAGGGDVCFFVGSAPPSARFLRAAEAEKLSVLALDIGAQGVHIADGGLRRVASSSDLSSKTPRG